MSSKHNDYDDEDDEEEDDEGDFVPGADDDDDLDDDFEEEDDVLDDGGSPFLTGHLYLDDGKLTFNDSHEGQSFRLDCSGALPTSWNLQNPALEKPIMFSGSVKVPIKAKIGIQKMDPAATIDPFEQRFLDTQMKMQALLEESSKGKPSAGAKSGDDDENENDGKKAPPVTQKQGDSESSSGDIYVFEGTQVGNDEDGTSRTFRGIFRAPSDSATRVYLTVAVQSSLAAASTASSPSKPAAAAARKRGRDDEDDGEKVAYQELIDLHDDAGLSTEELRQRYYGGSNDASITKKSKPSAADDSDDDDVGF